MPQDLQRLMESVLRKVLFAMLLLTLGCRAQAPQPNPEVNGRVERQVRAMIQAPPYVSIKVTDRKPDTEFSGYDRMTVTLSATTQDGSEKSQKVDFYISKDNKTLLSVNKIDLTKDPYADVTAKMDLSGRPVRGNKDAKVTVVVYDDYQCPFCTRMHQTINSSLKKYGDRVKVIYKDYPLFEIHPWAGRAAINAQCLADQNGGAYWDYTDSVHASLEAISGPREARRPLDRQFAELDRITTETGKKHGVDMSRLEACIKEQPRQKLDASVKEAESLGVQATPAIFVNGRKLEGAVPEEQFNAVLEQALAEANATASQSAAR